MTDKQTLLELAERCEAATGPDRELDSAIEAVLLNGGPEPSSIPSPRFTASLDAAMTLVPTPHPEIEFGARVNVELWDCNGVYADHVRATAWVIGARRTYAATPALALCAAALRVRAAA